MRNVKKKKKGKNLQSVVGLDAAVYLRTNEMTGFSLFDDLALALHPPSVTFPRALLPLPSREDAGYGRWD